MENGNEFGVPVVVNYRGARLTITRASNKTARDSQIVSPYFTSEKKSQTVKCRRERIKQAKPEDNQHEFGSAFE